MVEELYHCTHYITKFGNEYGSFNLECYSDDINAFILTALYVREEHREQGHGNELLKDAEDIARACNKSILLKVEQGTFMEDWYKRNGYRLHSDEDEYVWLIKDIYNDKGIERIH